MKRLLILPLFLLLTDCGRVGKLTNGKYEVSDQEYSSQNYSLQRLFDAQGGFEEKHVLDRCLVMEMKGKWIQKGGQLSLHYDQMRNRGSCRDSLAGWAKDSADLKIPVRNVEGGSFESFLAASDGKPEKWIRWLKTE